MDDNLSHYICIEVEINEKNLNWLAALAEIPQVSGVEEDDNFYKYFIKGDSLKKASPLIESLRERGISYRSQIIEPKNWNELWEKSFNPVEIDNDWRIRADFHPSKPEFRHEIIISPKMAFGTGHHPTTKLMLKLMSEIDFTSKRVLDMGCGTGILSIAAEKLGAAAIDAVDHDPLSVENTEENSRINDCIKISAQKGEVSNWDGIRFDIILANINRNALVKNMASLEDMLFPGGDILFSGILKTDIQPLKSVTKELIEQKVLTEEGWVGIHFRKKVVPIKTP